jgi:hypothetical protein
VRGIKVTPIRLNACSAHPATQFLLSAIISERILITNDRNLRVGWAFPRIRKPLLMGGKSGCGVASGERE